MLERAELQRLLDALRAAGYQVIGPTVRDAAIVYDAIERVEDLPAGWTDRQDGGRYRLERRADQALFGYAVGPQAWKRFVHPASLTLWRARREGAALRVEARADEAPRYALLGVRSCELHAIAIQDRVLIGDRHADPVYRARREAAFIVALNCGEAGGTCFCASMKTGPRVESGFDLALTELIDAQRHAFLVEVGSDKGAQLLERVPHREAGAGELAAEAALHEQRRPAAVVEVRVGEQHEVDRRRIEAERLCVLLLDLAPALVQAAIDEHAAIRALEEVAGAGVTPRSAPWNESFRVVSGREVR